MRVRFDHDFIQENPTNKRWLNSWTPKQYTKHNKMRWSNPVSDIEDLSSGNGLKSLSFSLLEKDQDEI